MKVQGAAWSPQACRHGTPAWGLFLCPSSCFRSGPWRAMVRGNGQPQALRPHSGLRNKPCAHQMNSKRPRHSSVKRIHSVSEAPGEQLQQHTVPCPSAPGGSLSSSLCSCLTSRPSGALPRGLRCGFPPGQGSSISHHPGPPHSLACGSPAPESDASPCVRSFSICLKIPLLAFLMHLFGLDHCKQTFA